MNKNLYILAFSALTTLSACDNFLETVPKGVVIPTTVEDFGNIMKDISLSTSYNATPYFCSDDVYLPDERINLTSPEHKAYYWMDNFYKVDESDRVWNDTYHNLYSINVVIQNIMGATNGTEADKNRIMSEAKILRAYYYWYLQSLYGKAYNEATAATDLSVPMPLEPNLEALLGRSSIAEVSQQITDDLQDLEKYLPEQGSNNYKPNKAAAYALQARVLFYMGKYDEAGAKAEKALELNNTVEDMRTWSFKDEFPSANINNKAEDITSPQKIWYHGCNSKNSLRMTVISDDLLKLYQQNPKDLRFKYWFAQVDRSGEPFYADSLYCYIQTTPNHNIGVPEMMLIKAESLARKNNPEALNVLNELRTYRFANEDYVPLTAEDGENLLQIVLDERRRELALSNLRWFDMKRLGEEGLYTETLTRTTPKGDAHNLKPKSNQYLFPIPLSIMKKNGNIAPNPRS